MKTMARQAMWMVVTALAGLGAEAHAQSGEAASASCTVTELVATNDKKGVDPKLERFKSKLTKPPLTAFDSFTFLGEQKLAIERQKPQHAKLVNGNLTLLFKDKLTVEGGKPRLRIGVEHDDKDGTRVVSTVVVFDSGDTVLVGGKPFEKGTYFLALGCTSN